MATESKYNFDNEVDVLRYYADCDVEHIEEQLRAKAQRIKDCMDDLLDRLDQGHMVNSLGVLQFSGIELDSLCGQFEMAKANRYRIERFAERLAKETEAATAE